jgi:3-dehydroquinate synthase class II
LDVVRRDQQVLVDPAVLRLDEPDAALFVQASDDFVIRSGEHVDDFAFRAAAPIVAGAFDVDAIPVEDLAHFARRNEQVIAAIVGNDESESIRMTLDRSTDEIELRGDAKLAATVAHHKAGMFELGDLRVDVVNCVIGHAKAARKLRQAQGNTRCRQRSKNLLARR